MNETPTQTVSPGFTFPPTWTAAPSLAPTPTATPSPSATQPPTLALPTPTETVAAHSDASDDSLLNLTTPWEPYHSERNPISLEHPSSLSVIESAGVVQFGNGDVILEEGLIYIAVTMFHFFPYDASYLPPDFAVRDPQASLQAMVDFYFQGPWEDETTMLIEPQPTTIDNYPAAWAEVRRQTEADERTGFPVDDVYVFSAILLEDRLVRVQMMSHDQSSVDLLPIYADRLLQSVRFE